MPVRSQQLIPATTVDGVYNPATQELTLSAEGEVRFVTVDIQFEPVPWVGGLKYALKGWVLPIEKPTPYSYQGSFRPIILPSPVNPLGSVIVESAGYPDGKLIDIKYLGFGKEIKIEPQSVVPSTTEIAPDLKIFALVGDSFNIKDKVFTDPTGEVSIHFDPEYLKLTNSGNHWGDIVWTFDPLRLGNTQVVVNITLPKPAILSLQKTYNVLIGVRDGSTVQLLTDGAPDNHQDFKERITEAVKDVKAKYPDAELQSVEAKPYLLDQAVSSQWGLVKLTAIFREGNKRTLITESLEDEPWGPIKPFEYVAIGLANIAWPDDAKVGLEEAAEKVDSLYVSARLFKVPGIEHAFYTFQLRDGKTVQIDAVTGDIIVGPVYGIWTKAAE